MVLLVIGLIANAWTCAYLIRTMARNAPDWYGRSTLFKLMALMVGVSAVGVVLMCFDRPGWAVAVVAAPLVVLCCVFAGVLAIGLLTGGRWN